MWEHSPGAWLDPACPVEWSHPLNVGLVGCWMVPPNAGWRGGLTLRDLVRGGRNPNDGTLTNMAFPGTSTSGWQSGAKGRPGGYGCVAFDGANDYAYAAAPASGLPLTLSFWMRISSSVISARLVTLSSGSLAHVQSVMVNGGGNFSAQSYTSGGPSNREAVRSGGIAQNVWIHVAASFTSAAGYLYVNGSLAASAVSAFSAGTSLSSLQIARNNWGTGEYAAASIDDVRVYNIALSDGEVAALYAESRQGYPEALRWISNRAWFLPESTGGISGDLAKTLSAPTISAAGTVRVAGDLSKSLAVPTSAAAGTVLVKADLAKTLSAPSLSSAATVLVTGSLSLPPAQCTSAAAGSVLVKASLAKTLSVPTLVGGSSQEIVGSLSKTLAVAALSAAGTVADAAETRTISLPAKRSNSLSLPAKRTNSISLPAKV